MLKSIKNICLIDFNRMCDTVDATILVNFKLETSLLTKGGFLSITTEQADSSINIYALSEILLPRIVFE